MKTTTIIACGCLALFYAIQAMFNTSTIDIQNHDTYYVYPYARFFLLISAIYAVGGFLLWKLDFTKKHNRLLIGLLVASVVLLLSLYHVFNPYWERRVYEGLTMLQYRHWVLSQTLSRFALALLSFLTIGAIVTRLLYIYTTRGKRPQHVETDAN